MHLIGIFKFNIGKEKDKNKVSSQKNLSFNICPVIEKKPRVYRVPYLNYYYRFTRQSLRNAFPNTIITPSFLMSTSSF